MPGRPGTAALFCNLFQQCGVDKLAAPGGGSRGGNFKRLGDASASVDREVGRVVLRLAGSLPAANSLRLPRRQEDSLDAPGRFLYLQLRLEPGKPFAVHADLLTSDRGLHRLTLSNLHAGREAARAQRSGVQVFLPAQHGGWTLLALDLGALARHASPRSPYARLRALQLCANMTVRCAFTSDTRYDWGTLPSDLCFTAAFDTAGASVLWVPEAPAVDEGVAPASRRRPVSPRPALPPPPMAAMSRAAPRAGAPDAQRQRQQQQAVQELQPSPAAEARWVSGYSGGHMGLLHWAPPASSGPCSTAEQQEIVFSAGPLIVALQPDNGRQRFLQGHARPVRALALADHGGCLASAEEGPDTALRLWDLREGQCLAAVPGEQWRRHSGGTTCLDLSPDGGLLASAGVDGQGRQEVVLWDVSACWAGAGRRASSGGVDNPASNNPASSNNGGSCKPRELARSASDYNIQALRFVPWGEPGRLVTCGKNSVRLHRLRDGQLRGLSVPFDGVAVAPRRQPYSCGTLATDAPASTVGEVFTCLGFERVQAAAPLAPRRLYVGALSGALYTIDLEARAVLGAAQLHGAPLMALAVRGSGCATGSADRLLRLWSADLEQPCIEAVHEGAVTGIAVSPDGQRMAVGTHSGALSLLDIPSQRYTTLLRSHTAAVHAVALLGQPPAAGQAPVPCYCTGGADGTVRIWDSSTQQQVLELTAPGETVLSLACHPGTLEVACGFHSGILRVFDAGSAALVQESQQHSGAVTQLAFARHGRLLLSLGEDGCVCAYDPQRAYMPTSYLLAGSPLHATALAASQDGRQLAVAALSVDTAGSSQRPSGSSAKGAVGAMARPMVVLYDAVTLQPTIYLQVAGSSPVAQLHLPPDAGLVLAATADGRLRGYRCADGGLVLDVPRCLPRPCLSTGLHPSGAFLVAGGSGGRLKVLGLHALYALQPAASRAADGPAAGPDGLPAAAAAAVAAEGGNSSAPVISSLPCQELAAPTGGSILGAAFVGCGGQLVTVGEGGSVCCWGFLGDGRRPCTAGEADSTAAWLQPAVELPSAVTGLPVAPSAAPAAAPAAAAGRQPTRPVFNLLADCTAAAPDTAVEPHCTPAAEPAGVAAAAAPEAAAGGGDSPPAPRAVPAVLQRPRPPSAPAGQPRPPAAADGDGQVRQCASLPTSPVRRRAKPPPPFWEHQRQPEASLVVTSAGGQRSAQVVRSEKRLVVTSPGKVPGAKGQPRSAEWARCEVVGDRIPPYRPEQALSLLPPSAAVQRVHGFDAAAGFCWLPAGSSWGEEAAATGGRPQPQQEQQLVTAAGNVVVVEAAGQQRRLARLPRNISALAVSPAAGLAAAAVQPAADCGSSGSSGGGADIHLLDLASGQALGVLSHHSYAASALAFSPDGAMLASISADPRRGSSLALWSVRRSSAEAELVAGVQLPQAVAGLAWCGDAELPTFYTAGPEGLFQWRLAPDALDSMAVHLPAVLRGVALTAVAWAEDAEWGAGPGVGRWRPAHRGSTLVAGDGSGRVWRLEVDEGQDVRRWQLLAQLQGQPVTSLQAAGTLVAAGTAGGTLLLLGAEGGQQADSSWRMLRCEQLDGAVLHIQLDCSSTAATAATASGTLWRLAPGGSPLPVLCGQPQAMRGWQLVPGAAWKGGEAIAAAASEAGVAVWQMGDAARVPLVEFTSPAGATNVALGDDASCCAAAYADGAICLFDVGEARLRWRVAGAAHQGGVAALAVVQRLRGLKVMVAYRSGALYVLDGGSGQVAHRTMQFAVRQDSGRPCPDNFSVAAMAVCPTDSAVFALCGQHDLVVCRAHWLKNAAVHALTRLSFGAADRSSAPATAPADDEWDARQPHAQAAFSRAHPGHLYCTDPCHPGQLLLLDYESQAVVKTLLVPLAAGMHITALALHPQEVLLAAGTSGGGVLLLRLESEAWAELAAHGEGAAVRGLAFSACGGRLFSAQGTATFEWGVAG